MKNIKPFLKWAGGKTQIIDKIQKNLPNNINTISSYYEPFVGGGSLFLFIATNYPNIKNFHINDLNYSVYNCWNVIKNNHIELITSLSKLKYYYLNLNEHQRKEYYYKIRELYNIKKLSSIENALYTIFLNKTCFNGLYRLNSKGYFNVPFGSYKNPQIFCKQNIINISKILKRTNITNLDFANLKYDNNSFIYCDPPYRPLNNSSSFNNYSRLAFDDREQVRLCNFLMNLKNNHIMLSNSDPKNTNINDFFFDKLYKKFHIQRITAKRVINSKSIGRGNVTELLITNY